MIGASGLLKIGKRGDGSPRCITRLELIAAIETIIDEKGYEVGLIHMLGGTSVEVEVAEALDLMKGLEQAASQIQFAPLVQPGNGLR